MSEADECSGTVKSGKEMNIIKISKNSSSNGTSTSTEAENTVNIIHKFEEALTRVQEAKRRYLDSYNRMETDDRRFELDLIRLEMEAAKEDSTNTEDLKDDSFIKALNDTTEGVWDDYREDAEE